MLRYWRNMADPSIVGVALVIPRQNTLYFSDTSGFKNCESGMAVYQQELAFRCLASTNLSGQRQP
jgi:hypothetical protein